MAVTKGQHTTLIAKGVEQDQPGYFSVYFERPDGFVFEAGDWIDIHFDGCELKGGVTYSISSSPLDDHLRITFREGVSEFKKALQTITPGERLYISQFGNDYGFQLKKNQSSTLIAGGVGIAPFRSMLKEMHENHGKNSVRLIYVNQNEQFLFQEELDAWAQTLPNIAISYVVTKGMNRKTREKFLISMIKNTTQQQNFYISGPPGMVESSEHLLIDCGVPIRNIRIDSFSGY